MKVRKMNEEPRTRLPYMRAIKEIATAVIKQAFEDAGKRPPKKKESKSQQITAATISEAQAFLLGSSKGWRESLDIFSDLAELDSEYVIRLAKQTKWYREREVRLHDS